MSHASHDAMRERIRMIRSLEADYGRPIGILVDLQGPKLRVGEFKDGVVELLKGATFVLDSDPTQATSIACSCRTGDFARPAAGSPHADRRRQGEAARSRSHARAIGLRRRDRRKVSNRKGVSLPDTEIQTRP